MATDTATDMAAQQQTGSETTGMPAALEEATVLPHEPIAGAGAAQAGIGNTAALTSKPGVRFLIIRVSQGGTSKANIRIPLGLARAAMKFIPHAEREHLKEQGIDVEYLLAGLTGDEEGMLVQVEAEDGTSVWIGVE